MENHIVRSSTAKHAPPFQIRCRGVIGKRYLTAYRFGRSMANAFPSVSRIEICAAMQTRGFAVHRCDDANLSGEEQFQGVGPIGTDHQGGYDLASGDRGAHGVLPMLLPKVQRWSV
jgi:hypothetical protein